MRALLALAAVCGPLRADPATFTGGAGHQQSGTYSNFGSIGAIVGHSVAATIDVRHGPLAIMPAGAGLWSFELSVTGAAVSRLTLGMALDASGYFDEGIDARSQAAPVGEGWATLRHRDVDYTRDLRASQHAAAWLLMVRAETDAVGVSWDPPVALPAAYVLTVARAEATGTPIGASSSMAETRTLSVAPGQTAYYRLRLGQLRSETLTLEPGWNLFSLPVAPIASANAAVFADLIGPGRAASAMQPWYWESGQFRTAAFIEPLRGYWLHLPDIEEQVTISIAGIPPESAAIWFRRGWTLFGAQATAALPDTPGLRHFYTWSDGQYRSAAQLQAKRAYWGFAPQDLRWDPSSATPCPLTVPHFSASNT